MSDKGNPNPMPEDIRKNFIAFSRKDNEHFQSEYALLLAKYGTLEIHAEVMEKRVTALQARMNTAANELDKIALNVEELSDVGAKFQADKIREQANRISIKIEKSGTG